MSARTALPEPLEPLQRWFSHPSATSPATHVAASRSVFLDDGLVSIIGANPPILNLGAAAGGGGEGEGRGEREGGGGSGDRNAQPLLCAQCTYIGSTLRPMYILLEYMDP